ncbi:MAG: NADH-quinone oxidoreductase subunit J [Thermoplasmata archaeon]|nr:MAG: NADH-quinone oxidoreductase subunit J [Thermoplasmata archaeon]
MEIAWDWIAFLVFSIIGLISALFVVESSEIVRSVVWLSLSFICVAGIFFMLNAEFVGIVQILVYVGAIAVVILFGIMLTKRKTVGAEKS